MSLLVSEETWDLLTSVLEPIPLDTKHSASLAAYPDLSFRPVGRDEMKSFLVVHLENEFLKVGVCPSLGGRIVAIFDKRTKLDLLPRLTKVDPGTGERWSHGIAILPQRGLGLGPVNCQFLDDDQEVGVRWWQLLPPLGIDVAVELKLMPGSARLLASITVHNRSLECRNVPLGINLGSILAEETALFVSPSGKLRDLTLLPGQVQQHLIEFSPVSGFEPNLGSGRTGGVGIEGENLTLQVAEPFLGHKLLLHTRDGQTLESPVDLYPEHLKVFDLGSLAAQVDVVALQSPAGETRFQFPDPQSSTPHRPVTVNLDEVSGAFTNDLHDLSKSMEPYFATAGFESASRVGQARRAISVEDWSRADELLEAALGHNAFDPLIWWLKAAVKREGGLSPEGEATERLNAHYLAPEEPVLRAEAFLNLGMNLGSEPSPLMKPLAEDLSLGNEVICRYLEAALTRSAIRLIDELLRHRENPTLRYLAAAQMLRRSGMEASAAEHVVIAGKQPLEPPFPTQPIERDAVTLLAAKFPDDARLASLNSLLQAVETRPPPATSLNG